MIITNISIGEKTERETCNNKI